MATETIAPPRTGGPVTLIDALQIIQQRVWIDHGNPACRHHWHGTGLRSAGHEFFNCSLCGAVMSEPTILFPDKGATLPSDEDLQSLNRSEIIGR